VVFTPQLLIIPLFISDTGPDAIAWFEYSGLIVAKISDCAGVGVYIYTNNESA
jgi:hypothetical protein